MPTARALFWATTIGAFALVIRTFWLGPLPLYVPSLVMVLYLVMIGLGIVYPRWGMFADVVEAAEPGRKLVGLTFDDGPDPEATPKVLDLLEQHGAKATFFVIGKKAEQHPDLLAKIVGRGHELGLHGYEHSRITAFCSQRFIETDLKRASEILQRYAAAPVRWFRPPIGHVTLRIGHVAQRLGLTIVCWTVRGLDGLSSAEPARVARRVCQGLEDGAIIALHEAFERHAGVTAGVAALESILTEMDARGLRSVTLTELLVGPAEASPDRLAAR